MSYSLSKVEIGKVSIIHIMVFACMVIYTSCLYKKTTIQVCMYNVLSYQNFTLSHSVVLPDESLLLYIHNYINTNMQALLIRYSGLLLILD